MDPKSVLIRETEVTFTTSRVNRSPLQMGRSVLFRNEDKVAQRAVAAFDVVDFVQRHT
jgi:hypothetical protein